MRKLEMPIEDPGQVFLICISRVSDAELKARLTCVEADIVNASMEFVNAVSTSALHTLPRQEGINGIVSNEEMSDVYTKRMAKKGQPGRPIYEKLLAAPAFGQCPLCGQRIVSTLDHHLPKAHYSALVVAPVNLVPSCADCNKAKLAATPNVQEEQTLHPYFDDIEGVSWLYADVIEATPPALRFFVHAPECWDELMLERVSYHFRVFKLAELYTKHAAVELVNIRYALNRLYEEAGRDGIKTHLLEQAGSREAAHINSWQTAMYKALAASDWYCNGGFRAGE